MSHTTRPWTAISSDPNDPAVIRNNEAVLRAARQAPVPSRSAYLVSLATGRKVLDIGVVEHFKESRASDAWLHRQLRAAARQCIGVDILEDEIASLRDEGYDVVAHDVTESPLGDRFDLIVAGELVEHLGNPDGLFRNARVMLNPDGRLVVTTPNPYMLHRVIHAMRGHFRDSVDHVTLFGPSHVLELARRNGLFLDAWRGIQLKRLPGAKGAVVGLARRGLSKTVFRPEIDCDSIIYEFKR